MDFLIYMCARVRLYGHCMGTIFYFLFSIGFAHLNR